MLTGESSPQVTTAMVKQLVATTTLYQYVPGLFARPDKYLDEARWTTHELLLARFHYAGYAQEIVPAERPAGKRFDDEFLLELRDQYNALGGERRRARSWSSETRWIVIDEWVTERRAHKRRYELFSFGDRVDAERAGAVREVRRRLDEVLRNRDARRVAREQGSEAAEAPGYRAREQGYYP